MARPIVAITTSGAELPNRANENGHIAFALPEAPTTQIRRA